MTLPRAVAPYTVIRTTAIWNPTDEDQRRFNLFGPVMGVARDAGQWTNLYSFGPTGPMTSLLSTTNGATCQGFKSMSTNAWSAASITPAAFSIQIMNPEALQTSAGMVYIGRCKNKVALAEGDLSTAWQDVADNLVSYSNPRLCSAGKLALRGVQVDAVPNNMSELSKFTTKSSLSIPQTLTLTPTNTIHGEGFNPIFVYNPNAIDLQILVCCEWRVRFDPSNPAYSACKMQKPTSDAEWYSNMASAVSIGSGVVDIVERVAQMGRAAPVL